MGNILDGKHFFPFDEAIIIHNVYAVAVYFDIGMIHVSDPDQNRRGKQGKPKHDQHRRETFYGDGSINRKKEDQPAEQSSIDQKQELQQF